MKIARCSKAAYIGTDIGRRADNGRQVALLQRRGVLASPSGSSGTRPRNLDHGGELTATLNQFGLAAPDL